MQEERLGARDGWNEGVVYALVSAEGDFVRAITGAVMAGWDTDCNGATVGALAALSGAVVDDRWSTHWGRLGLGLAGHDEIRIGEPVDRTARVATRFYDETRGPRAVGH